MCSQVRVTIEVADFVDCSDLPDVFQLLLIVNGWIMVTASHPYYLFSRLFFLIQESMATNAGSQHGRVIWSGPLRNKDKFLANVNLLSYCDEAFPGPMYVYSISCACDL